VTLVTDMVPPGADWLVRRVTDLERQVREPQAGRRLQAATLDASRGALRVVDGYVEVLRIGDLGGGWRGTVVRRRTGQTAFTAWSPADGDPGYVGVYDLVGTAIFSDDVASGHGMATPYLSLPMGMAINSETASLLPGTTSGSWTGLWQATVPLTHPKLRVKALFGDDVAGTAGQGRLTIDGTQVGDAVTLSSDWAWLDTTVDIPDWSSRSYLGEADIELQARHTGGTGRVICSVYTLYGRQS
jgi:hypothetical protein